jgi:ADP-heptose:LPS heptosyltransferase
MLMVSGVIMQISEQDKSRRFNLVRRSMYRNIFQNHHAIQKIGFPSPGEHIIGTDYWKYGIGPHENRPYQIISRILGLPTPAKEILYFPGPIGIDPVLEKMIPWRKKNVVIATSSDSPRKKMDLDRWRLLVKQLKGDDFCVIQTGKLQEAYVDHSYSLRGLTNLGELIAVIRRADVVITLDTFAMHAAYLAGTPAVVLWGPTDPKVYGYPGQHHFRPVPSCAQIEQCISDKIPNSYSTPCPRPGRHCLDLISLGDIRRTVHEILD